jgi:hypothetical protein
MILPCPRIAAVGDPDVRLRPGRAAQFAAARAHEAARRSRRTWFHSLRLPDGSTYLRWHGLFEFLISADARRILYRRLPGATRESFGVYLLGQVLSFILLARGTEALHATAVLIGREAVAFVGDCGYGKSTLGAAFLASGFPLVTDDLAALERRHGRWAVHPGIPRLKLLPVTARRLLGSTRNGVPMNRGTMKLVLRVDSAHAGRRPAPLKAIYVLADPVEQRGCRRVGVERLAGREAFLEVIRATFNLIVLERPRMENQFRLAKALVADVPIKRLTYPRSVRQLPKVCLAVLDDLGREGRVTLPA